METLKDTGDFNDSVSLIKTPSSSSLYQVCTEQRYIKDKIYKKIYRKICSL